MISSLKTYFRNHPYIANSILVLCSTGITILTLEILFRLCVWMTYPHIYSELVYYQKGASADNTLKTFQPHPYLSYSRSDTYYDENGIHIGDQYFTFEKPPNTVRIACIGGSTTMNQHPLFLGQYLNDQDSNLQYEVMDFGCNGWTSQESLINYQIRVKDFSPDYLLIHHGVNDGPPRIWGDWKPDYSNFRVSWHDQCGPVLRFLSKRSFTVMGVLYLKGILAFDIQNYVVKWLSPLQHKDTLSPESIHTLKRNIHTIVTLAKQNKTNVILAPVHYNSTNNSKHEKEMYDQNRELILDYAKEHSIPCVDHKWVLEQNTDWFADKVHLLTPGIFTNAQLFAAAIKDHLRGYSEIINSDGSVEQKEILIYNDEWMPQRQIEVNWALHIPNTVEYHVYLKEYDRPTLHYLARIRDPDVHTFTWKLDNPLAFPEYQNGPEIGQEYWFYVYAITGKPPHPSVGREQIKGIFEVKEKYVYLH